MEVVKVLVPIARRARALKQTSNRRIGGMQVVFFSRKLSIGFHQTYLHLSPWTEGFGDGANRVVIAFLVRKNVLHFF